MRFVEFFDSNGSLIIVNPATVEALSLMDNDWTGGTQYTGAYTRIRFFSGQLAIVQGSLCNTVEKLNYGEQYNG